MKYTDVALTIHKTEKTKNNIIMHSSDKKTIYFKLTYKNASNFLSSSKERKVSCQMLSEWVVKQSLIMCTDSCICIKLAFSFDLPSKLLPFREWGQVKVKAKAEKRRHFC